MKKGLAKTAKKRLASIYSKLDNLFLKKNVAETDRYSCFYKKKKFIRSFVFQKRKTETNNAESEKKNEEVKDGEEKDGNKIDRINRREGIKNFNKIKDINYTYNEKLYLYNFSKDVIPYLCIKKEQKNVTIEKETIWNIFRMLMNEKETEYTFNYLYVISKIYEDLITKENAENAKNTETTENTKNTETTKTTENIEVKNLVKINIDYIIKENKYSYLFKCFEMAVLYKIYDIKLIQKILLLILKNQIYSEEEKIRDSYYMIKFLNEKKIYNKIVKKIINRYLFVLPSFWNIIQRFNYENSFILFFQYSINSNVKPSFLFLEKYTRFYTDMVNKSFHFKYITGKKGVMCFQNMLLLCNFYSSDFNLMIKKYIENYLVVLNPSDILALSSNLFLSFTKCDYLILKDEKVNGSTGTYRKNKNVSNAINNNTNNNAINLMLIKNKTNKELDVDTVMNIKNDKRKRRNNDYYFFLSLKYLSDKSIRMVDNYLSNLNNMDYIFKYFILTSFCHFSLFNNWWSDTSIYMKIKQKKRKLKKVIKSRVPYMKHIIEKVFHFLESVIYRYEDSQKYLISSETDDITIFNKFEYSIKDSSKESNNISSLKKNNGMEYLYVLPYLLKSFLRAFMLKPNEKCNKQHYMFFYDMLKQSIQLNVIYYENKREQLRKISIIQEEKQEEEEKEEVEKEEVEAKEEEKEVEAKNILSLYELSTVGELFFILENLFIGCSENVYTYDLFEKALYIYLNRIHVFFFKKYLDFDCLNDNYFKNVLNKYVNGSEPFFNFYLLLRVLLPIVCTDDLNFYLNYTKQVILNILLLPFSQNLLFREIDEQHDGSEVTEFRQFYRFIECLKKWENNTISINTQRRIRKKTKRKNCIFDFIYANEFMRPSFIYILCLKKIKKKTEMCSYFLSHILKTDKVSTKSKQLFETTVNHLYNSFDINFRKSRKKKANTLLELNKKIVITHR